MLARLPFSQVASSRRRHGRYGKNPPSTVKDLRPWWHIGYGCFVTGFPKEEAPPKRGFEHRSSAAFAAVEAVCYLHCEGTYLALMPPSVAGATSGGVEATTS